MEVNSKSRLMLTLQSALFAVLLLVAVGLIAWLSQRYAFTADWTAAGRNSLSPASVELLKAIDGPVGVSAYAREDKLLRQAIRNLIERYRRHSPDIELTFIDPDRNPDEVRRLGISVSGELVLTANQRSAHVTELNERSFTNALHRVARAHDRRVVYLKGHGERDLLGRANHDLGRFGAQLENRGFTVIGVNLAEVGAIPGNADLLVLSRGEVGLLPGEAALIRRFIAAGGNLLWLAEPAAAGARPFLAESLGVRFLPGKVLEPNARLFGVDDPAMVVVTRYRPHAVTRRFDLVTVFPGAAAIEGVEKDGWRVTPLLETTEQSWSDAGAGDANAGGASGELEGPLNIGLALERPHPGGANAETQHVAVFGDGDFLANGYLGNGGNLQLGLNLVNWLAGDESLIHIPARTATDLNFALSRGLTLIVAFVPLAVIPLALLAVGFGVWKVRRGR